MSNQARWLQQLSDGNCILALAANIFVGYDYQKAAAGTGSLGVINDPYNAGQRVEVTTIGTAYLKLGTGGCVKGDALTPDASGFGVVAAPGQSVGAFALEAGSAGDVVEVMVAQDKGTVSSFAQGETTLVGGTKAVTIAGVTTSSKFIITRKTPGGTVGNLSYAPTTNTLTINSDNALDTSVVDYFQIA